MQQPREVNTDRRDYVASQPDYDETHLADSTVRKFTVVASGNAVDGYNVEVFDPEFYKTFEVETTRRQMDRWLKKEPFDFLKFMQHAKALKLAGNLTLLPKE